MNSPIPKFKQASLLRCNRSQKTSKKFLRPNLKPKSKQYKTKNKGPLQKQVQFKLKPIRSFKKQKMPALNNKAKPNKLVKSAPNSKKTQKKDPYLNLVEFPNRL